MIGDEKVELEIKIRMEQDEKSRCFLAAYAAGQSESLQSGRGCGHQRGQPEGTQLF